MIYGTNVAWSTDLGGTSVTAICNCTENTISVKAYDSIPSTPQPLFRQSSNSSSPAWYWTYVNNLQDREFGAEPGVRACVRTLRVTRWRQASWSRLSINLICVIVDRDRFGGRQAFPAVEMVDNEAVYFSLQLCCSTASNIIHATYDLSQWYSGSYDDECFSREFGNFDGI